MAVCSLCGKKALYFIGRRWFCSFCVYDVLGKPVPEMVFADVETTGVNPHQDSIVQISAVRYRGGKKVDVMDTYINPLRKIPPESTMIHGITDEMVCSSPRIEDVRSQFMEFIDGAVLIGYNVLFDLRFLNRAFRGELGGSRYIDVLPMVRDRKFNLADNKLETVATHLGFHPEGGFHDSLTDCEATAAVYFHLARAGQWGTSVEFQDAETNTQKRWPKSTPPQKIVPRGIPADESHPLYGKKIAFTGDLSVDRDAAMQMAADVGAVITNSVSGKTNFLVVGQPNISLLGSSGISTKEKKAHELNASGKGHIAILSEQDFLDLVGSKTEGGSL